MRTFKVLDLFSGAGGMGEGFLQAGFEISAASDYSKEASSTYINRHKQLGLEVNFFEGDITKLTKKKLLFNLLNGNKIDVVVGGPPCQGFSLTGKRAIDDPRNELFMEFLKIIDLTKPRYFVMENVMGILSYKIQKIKGVSGTEYLDELVINVLKNEAFLMGYMLKWEILNAKDYGVPQNRPRVIFFGHRIRKRLGKTFDIVVPPKFPKPLNERPSVIEAISDLSFLKSGESAFDYKTNQNLSSYQTKLRFGQTPSKVGFPIRAERIHNHFASKHGEITTLRFQMLQPGENIGNLLSRIKGGLPLEEFNKINTKKRSCIKLNADGISPTVLTLPDDIIHYDPLNPRILTVRELARLQSFDDSFVFLGKRTTGGVRRKLETPQYTQVGNAVPPFFARAIAQQIKEALICTENEHKGE